MPFFSCESIMGQPNVTEKKNLSQFAGVNRRATVRYRCNPTNLGRAFVANTSKCVDAVVLDISQGGIGLILSRYVEPGTVLRVEFAYGEEAAFAELAANVTHAAELEEGKWRCGCRWLRELTNDELIALR
jgi:hypothetical protein